ncbi:hypothetical protein WKI68_01105 [Streptomyces sp. MS1.HAVA.3]|uniref:Uncharacterized protein n=1 Tax=Streptomyces caledonius TaxID=3134107 RepID=A0ABU8TXR8_9ACTN
MDSNRLTVARLTVGGDAAISASGKSPLPDGLAKAAAELPGVRTSVPLWIDHDSSIIGADQGSTQVTVIVAEPAAYAELSRVLGCGSFNPALLSGGGAQPADAPVPALFSSGLAQKAAPGTYTVRPGDGGEVRARVTGVIDCTRPCRLRAPRPSSCPRAPRRPSSAAPTTRTAGSASVPSTGTGCAPWSGPRSRRHRRLPLRRLRRRRPPKAWIRPPRRTRSTTCIP